MMQMRKVEMQTLKKGVMQTRKKSHNGRDLFVFHMTILNFAMQL